MLADAIRGKFDIMFHPNGWADLPMGGLLLTPVGYNIISYSI
jgi:hypothetical protein